MVKVQVLYEGDLITVATHEPSKETLHTDAPIDSGGKGRTFSPTDLLAVALASCVATVMAMYAEKKSIDLRGMRMEIEKKMSKNPPRRVDKLDLHVWMPISISDEEKKKLQNVAMTCPVHHSLHQDIEKNIVFHWQ